MRRRVSITTSTAWPRSAGVDIGDAFPHFLEALRQRHDFFHRAGCRLSDHGLETIDAVEGTALEATGIFARVRRGEYAARARRRWRIFRSAMLHEMALWDHQRGWTQQFHVGALRNNNTRMFDSVGPTRASIRLPTEPMPAGCRGSSIGSTARTSWPRRSSTIFNPAHNEVLATMIGNFQDGSGAPSGSGKLQFGSSWWFLDQKDGMEKQINCLSNLGLLSCFVGMLTDSRSFLSYTRHEYFRRILCNLLGAEMRQGLLPDDFDLVGGLVRDVCYYNAKRYFGFELRE